MTHVSLDDPQVDAGLEKMGGIGVPESVNGDHLFENTRSKLGPTEGPLDTAFGHGSLRLSDPLSGSANGWEEEGRMTVGDPIATKQVEGGLGKRDVTIFGALSPVDMDHHAVAIDIGDFEIESFMKPEAAGIYGGKIGIVLEGFHLRQEFTDFLNTQDGRESSFGLGSEDSEDVPVSLKDMLVKSVCRNSISAWYWVPTY